MLREDATASELRALLRDVCPILALRDEERPLPLPVAPPEATSDLAADLVTARKASLSRCFPSAAPKGAKGGAAPVVFVAE
mmetsp:Transcript_87937/g.264468  ORF Transcript_87937/g.264468 Transcript_87937/m.264468 type:complete len:81 (+) Transcript_87937:240-482(+)